MISKFKTYDLYLYIVIAYLFSLACRYIWIYQFSGYAPFLWHNQLMINTNDGYYFATVVKNLLSNSNPNNQLLQSAIDTYPATVYSVYYLVKFLPFSLDSIILYLPAFVSSFIVIPVILIMRLYKFTFLGFLASLLASISWSFYNRTMSGYFDTDMYALVFPVFILYYFMRFIKDNSLSTIFIIAILNSSYVIFYPQGYAIVSALFISFIVYELVFIKDKQNLYLSIILLSISLIKIMFLVKVIFIIAIFFYIKQNVIEEKKAIYLAVLSLLLFFVFGNAYELIVSKIGWYTKTGVEGGVLHFYDVAQTIREAGKIPFNRFADRISGSVFLFIFSFFGYLFLSFKRKEFLLFLPLVGIGFFAYIGGLRFTVYAIPAMSIGSVYLLYYLVDKFLDNKIVKYILVLSVFVVFLYPNIRHIIEYRVPTVFNHKEVAVLDKFKNLSSTKDYTVTWWDYAYPIWYYSETNTLIDGGKHHHDNYIVSKILTTDSQIQAANLARVSVEKYVEKNLQYKAVADYIFENNATTALDVSNVLKKMDSYEYKLPKKTRDIYIYLPYRMLSIFPTVNLFSNLDLNTGKRKVGKFFFISRNFRQIGNEIILGKGISFLNDIGVLKLGNKEIMIKHFCSVDYDKKGKLEVNDQVINYNSRLNIIYMQSYNTILVLDDKMYNSLFIQMFVFENYNKKLFEPVIKDPFIKIYRLKR